MTRKEFRHMKKVLGATVTLDNGKSYILAHVCRKNPENVALYSEEHDAFFFAYYAWIINIDNTQLKRVKRSSKEKMKDIFMPKKKK